jgi:hypothetical protein
MMPTALPFHIASRRIFHDNAFYSLRLRLFSVLFGTPFLSPLRLPLDDRALWLASLSFWDSQSDAKHLDRLASVHKPSKTQIDPKRKRI